MTFDFTEGGVIEFERAPRDLPNFFAFGAYYSIFVDVRRGLRRRRHHRKHRGDEQRSEADKELLLHDRSPPDHPSGNPASGWERLVLVTPRRFLRATETVDVGWPRSAFAVAFPAARTSLLAM